MRSRVPAMPRLKVVLLSAVAMRPSSDSALDL
jgi:hypothetical protein